jgi:hypothetical protein
VTGRAQQRALAQNRIRGERSFANSPANNPRLVRLNIAEMEFRGFGRSSAFRAADRFQGELASLLARDGVPPHWLAAGKMDDLRVSTLDFSLATALASAGKEILR